MKQSILTLIAIIVVITAINCDTAQQRQTAGKSSMIASTSGSRSSGSRGVVSETKERVSFQTSDGIVIVGSLFTTGSASSPVVICLHMWRSDRTAYDELASRFIEQNVAVLSFDMRGWGESTKRANGQSVEPDRRAEEDIGAAIRFLRASNKLDANRIGLIGASYGGSNALIYAAKHREIKAVALLSPGLNYFNVLPTEPAIVEYGDRPLLSIASKEDGRSVEAVKLYQSKKASNHDVVLYENFGHGTSMLKGKAEVIQKLVKFFNQHL